MNKVVPPQQRLWSRLRGVGPVVALLLFLSVLGLTGVNAFPGLHDSPLAWVRWLIMLPILGIGGLCVEAVVEGFVAIGTKRWRERPWELLGLIIAVMVSLLALGVAWVILR